LHEPGRLPENDEHDAVWRSQATKPVAVAMAVFEKIPTTPVFRASADRIIS